MNPPDEDSNSSNAINQEATTSVSVLGSPLSVYIITFHYLYVEFSFGVMSVQFLEFLGMVDYNSMERTFLLTSLNILVIISPLIGGIMADSWFGQFNTIFHLSTVYVCGYVLLSFSAISLSNHLLRVVSIIGYLLVLIGCVGLNPCAVPFAGDQYQLPAQRVKLSQFFTYFYVSLKIEDAISSYISSVFEINVGCFGEEQCFVIPFGLSALSMTIMTIIFFFCRPLYVVDGIENNLLLEAVRCVSHAINNRRKAEDTDKSHWLDYADDEYDQELIEDIKRAIRCLLIYIPVSCFSITHDIITSGWGFMATRMDGNIGQITIMPSYLTFVNPALVLVFAPLFNEVLYPFFAKKNLLKTKLYRMQFGGLFLSLSFISSGILIAALKLEYPKFPGKGEAQLRIYNTLPCVVNIKNEQFSHILYPLTIHNKKIWEVNESQNFWYHISVDSCPDVPTGSFVHNFTLEEKDVIAHHLTLNEHNQVSVISFQDSIAKNHEGFPNIRNLVSTKNGEVLPLSYLKNEEVTTTIDSSQFDFIEQLNPGTYTLQLNGTIVGLVDLKLGGVYAMLISFVNPDKPKSDLIEITKPNKVHVFWLMPQYILNALGEVLFSISGLEFTYTQAPNNMKSVMEATWIFPSSIANILIAVLEKFGELDYQLIVMILYFFFFLLFVLIVQYLKYVEH